MKKLLILILTCAFIIPASGQNAVEILNAVNKKYAGFSSYSADFTTSMGSGMTSGSILSQGAKYKITFGGQELYNNGKEVYTYLPDANEVNITTYNPGDESDISPNNIFNLYKKGYSASYKQERTISGKKFDVVELKPKKKSGISKVELVIGKTDRLVSSWIITETSGSSSQYSILKFTPNVKVDNSTFTFDTKKYPKVEVIDLR